MNNSPKLPFAARQLLQKALEKPLITAVIIAVVTLVMAGLGFTWFWFVGGVALWVTLYPGMFGINVNRPGAAPPNQIGATQPAIPDLSQLQGQYRDQVQRALSTRRSIEQAVTQTQDAGQKQVLEDATKELPELTNNIFSLALKAQGVQSALSTSSSVNGLTSEVEHLETAIKNTTDEFQKSQYYAAMDGKLQQMQNMTDTTVAMQRWDAQISNALSTMDTLLSQVLRIKSSEVLSYTGATDDLSNRLKGEVDALKATSEAMDNVYGWNS